MNILYLSNLSGNPWAGPTYSVPAQIIAQAKYDNVFWYNLVDSTDPQTLANVKQLTWNNLPFYHNLDEFPHKNISKLPPPFNKPDLIILEQFYTYGNFFSLVRWIKKSKIPYILVPRGELTQSAQHKKWLKKQLANWLFFYSFAKKATAIEYLTKQEATDAGVKWNRHQIIIPNGINLPSVPVKAYQPNKSLKLVFLGRLDPYHKGIDLLIQACQHIETSLRQSHLHIDIYGPDRIHKRAELEQQNKDLGIADIIQFHEGLYRQEKVAVLQQADLFIMSSRFEGHPMGLIEALAYGLPCIATTGTNMREEIERFDAGWTADNTAESITTALTKMLAERNTLTQKSVNARRLAAEYDWNEIAKKSHQIYEEIIRRNK